jgi:hypothetical protein
MSAAAVDEVLARRFRINPPPTVAPEQPSGGLRFANPPYALRLEERAEDLRPSLLELDILLEPEL